MLRSATPICTGLYIPGDPKVPAQVCDLPVDVDGHAAITAVLGCVVTEELRPADDLVVVTDALANLVHDRLARPNIRATALLHTVKAAQATGAYPNVAGAQNPRTMAEQWRHNIRVYGPALFLGYDLDADTWTPVAPGLLDLARTAAVLHHA